MFEFSRGISTQVGHASLWILLMLAATSPTTRLAEECGQCLFERVNLLRLSNFRIAVCIHMLKTIPCMDSASSI